MLNKLRSELEQGRTSRTRQRSRPLRLDLSELEHVRALSELSDGVVKIAAVDPSVRATGWATAEFTVTPDGILCEIQRAGVVLLKAAPGLYPVPQMVKGVIEEIEGCDAVVFEFPEVYGTNKAEDPNSVLPLTAVLGGVVCSKLWTGQFAYHPREWKGEAPKDVHQARELRTVPDAWIRTYLPDHNATDAALLLRWFAEKIGAKVTFKV
jgi:hypothetical protein